MPAENDAEEETPSINVPVAMWVSLMPACRTDLTSHRTLVTAIPRDAVARNWIALASSKVYESANGFGGLS